MANPQPQSSSLDPYAPQSKDLGDGFTLNVGKLPGRKGFRVFNRVVKMLGTLSGGAKDLAKGAAALATGKDPKLDAQLGGALFSALAGVSEDDLDFLATELLATAVMNCPDGKGLPIGQSTHFDTVFAGRVDLIYKAIFFALQVNYGGFMKGWVAGLMAKLGALAPAPVKE
jgi:hypothetical protein